METASLEIVPIEAPTPGFLQTRLQNEEARISFLLPAGWEVSDPFPVSITTNGRHDDHLYNMGNQPETSGGPVTSHLIVADPQKLTIETFAQYQCSTCSMNPIETFMLGEIPAKHTIIGGGSVPSEMEWFFMEHNGDPIGFSIHNPETLETLEEINQTLRLE